MSEKHGSSTGTNFLCWQSIYFQRSVTSGGLLVPSVTNQTKGTHVLYIKAQYVQKFSYPYGQSGCYQYVHINSG